MITAKQAKLRADLYNAQKSALSIIECKVDYASSRGRLSVHYTEKLTHPKLTKADRKALKNLKYKLTKINKTTWKIDYDIDTQQIFNLPKGVVAIVHKGTNLVVDSKEKFDFNKHNVIIGK